MIFAKQVNIHLTSKRETKTMLESLALFSEVNQPNAWIENYLNNNARAIACWSNISIFNFEHQ